MTQTDLPLAKTTAKTEILRRLREEGRPMACHEFQLIGYSENAIATRLSELAKSGIVVGRKRIGKNYHEWSLVERGPQTGIGPERQEA